MNASAYVHVYARERECEIARKAMKTSTSEHECKVDEPICLLRKVEVRVNVSGCVRVCVCLCVCGRACACACVSVSVIVRVVASVRK